MSTFLRLLALLLLCLNLGYLAWSQGWLRAYGLGPEQINEPDRLQQQIRPQAIRLLTPEQIRELEAAARAASESTP